MSESDECYCVIMRNTVSSPFLEYFRKSSLRPWKGVLSIPYPYKVLEKYSLDFGIYHQNLYRTIPKYLPGPFSIPNLFKFL